MQWKNHMWVTRVKFQNFRLLTNYGPLLSSEEQRFPAKFHMQFWREKSVSSSILCKRTTLKGLGTGIHPLFERYVFKRTRRWPGGRSSACWLHHSISVSAIHAGVPGLLRPLSPQEQSAEQWFKCTSVLLCFCHHKRYSLQSKASQVFGQQALSPR